MDKDSHSDKKKFAETKVVALFFHRSAFIQCYSWILNIPYRTSKLHLLFILTDDEICFINHHGLNGLTRLLTDKLTSMMMLLLF